MANPMPPGFLDVAQLLDRSVPASRATWFWSAAGLFGGLALVGALVASNAGDSRMAGGMVLLIGLGIMTGLMSLAWLAARSAAAEQARLEAVEELIQLRRWPEAAMLLQAALSRPARTAQGRAQALIYLSAVLARYHRFGDAVAVYEELLSLPGLDDDAAYSLRLGRAMSLLREDRLFDADRAIAELRRQRDGQQAGGLALVELYRDVKTGHPNEAIEIFQARRDVMRRQLGSRLADALALASCAHDMIGAADAAESLYRDATTLAMEAELLRRYPELERLKGRYAAAAPPESP